MPFRQSTDQLQLVAEVTRSTRTRLAHRLSFSDIDGSGGPLPDLSLSMTVLMAFFIVLFFFVVVGCIVNGQDATCCALECECIRASN